MPEPAYSIFDDEEDIPCDPGPDWTHYRAMSILQSLVQACRNECPAWCLDAALLSIDNRSRDPAMRGWQLHDRDRDSILTAITRAKALMPFYIPEYPAEQFRLGLEAAAMQIILWAETDAQREVRHPDVASDAHDYALLLRHDMKNWCLRDRIRERAHRRRAATVSALLDVPSERFFG